MFVQVQEKDLSMIDSLLQDDNLRIGFGKTCVTKKVYMDYTLECITDPSKKSYFWFNDGQELPSSIITIFNYRLIPYWSFQNFRVLDQNNYWNAKTNGWAYFGQLISKQEQLGRYTFVYLKTITRNKPHYRRQPNEIERFTIDPNWDKSDNFFDRYIRTVEEYIPAGNFSKWDLYKHSLFRGATLNEDSIITKWTCKQEYRTDVYSSFSQK